MFFSSAKHSEIKEANLEASFGDMGKLVGVSWKELSNGKKAEWEEKVKLDKVCHKKDMDGYSAPSDDDDNEEDSGNNDVKVKKKLKAKRAKKDPNVHAVFQFRPGKNLGGNSRHFPGHCGKADWIPVQNHTRQQEGRVAV